MDSNGITYGYKKIDGEFVVHKGESVDIKWVFNTRMKFCEHPPACLVEKVIAEHKGELSYAEAEKRVSAEDKFAYIEKERRARWELFYNIISDEMADRVQEIFDMPFDEVISHLAQYSLGVEMPSYIKALMAKKGCQRPEVVEHNPILSQSGFDAAQAKIATNEPKTLAELLSEGGAKCKICGQRMLKAEGCDCAMIEYGGQKYLRLEAEDDCHDCGAKAGHYHHFGCDMETCPVCGGQLISCDCEIEYVSEE